MLKYYPLPPKVPLPAGGRGHHQICNSLGYQKSTSLTASQSIQPFLQQGSRNKHTDRQTTLCSSRPHLMPRNEIRPNNTSTAGVSITVVVNWRMSLVEWYKLGEWGLVGPRLVVRRHLARCHHLAWWDGAALGMCSQGSRYWRLAWTTHVLAASSGRVGWHVALLRRQGTGHRCMQHITNTAQWQYPNIITYHLNSRSPIQSNAHKLGMSVLCKYATATSFAYCRFFSIFQQNAHTAYFSPHKLAFSTPIVILFVFLLPISIRFRYLYHLVANRMAPSMCLDPCGTRWSSWFQAILYHISAAYLVFMPSTYF